MLYIRPDYYDDFRCIADKCRHSCCVGWEIDIDEESLRRFTDTGGSLGEKLRHSISTLDTPHFILREDGRCPFLKKNGLCELICELGEESLCDICTEHPRFYNACGDVFEEGLGMCCEEAARLLLSGTEAVRLIAEDDGEDNEIPPLVRLRGEIFSCLAADGLSFSEKEKAAFALLDAKPHSFDANRDGELLLRLERMEERWGEMLADMTRRGHGRDGKINTVRYERICEYFVFRHFACASDMADAIKRLKFCFFATDCIFCLECLGYEEDALRLFSAEIEYSDENVEIILNYLQRE